MAFDKFAEPLSFVHGNIWSSCLRRQYIRWLEADNEQLSFYTCKLYWKDIQFVILLFCFGHWFGFIFIMIFCQHDDFQLKHYFKIKIYVKRNKNCQTLYMLLKELWKYIKSQYDVT